MTHAKKSNAVKLSRSDLIFNIINYIILSLTLLIVIYPIWFIVIASVSNPAMVTLGKVTFLPKGFTLEGYEKALEYRDIWIGFRNSIIYTILSTLIGTAITITAGYVISRKDLVGRKAFLFFFMLTMFFSGGLIPTYIVVDKLGLVNTIWSVFLPSCVSVYNMMIARTFFRTTIPDELLEAAQIDGCSNIRFFFTIVIPLSKAVIAVIILYYAVAEWNSFFNALIYLKKRELYPLQIHLRNILLLNSVDASMLSDASSAERQNVADMMKYVLIIVSCIPMFILYPFIQKYFVKGVMIGSVKG